MKIAHKIILGELFDLLLLALIAFFAYENLNMVLTKLHFVELADDLNDFFLEARLSEKNYFLYGDASALTEIQKKLDQAIFIVEDERERIVRATGEQNFLKLNKSLQTYRQTIQNPGGNKEDNPDMQARIREAGQKLREFSHDITQLERKNVNNIISRSKHVLFVTFILILLSSLVVNRLIFRRILESLKLIEETAHTVSEGDFTEVASEISPDELGSVTTAINSMCRELRNREELLIQSKKLASLGVLTAGVAHELGNPLNNISMLAQAYQELYDDLDADERLEYMQRVDEETIRIKEIVKNLLDFSKPKKANLQEADINDVVKKSLRLVQNMINIGNIETRLSLQSGLPPLTVDAYQIIEVLVNLLTNGIHVLLPGEKLEVTTKLSENGDHVEIEVKDTGKGIPPENLANIFDPFFTTKGASGTGLGLFVSYGIIQNHGGTIRVNSKVGEGTCFTITLPAHTTERKRNEKPQNHGD
jgi:two-component system NtrC family sensor kinase